MIQAIPGLLSYIPAAAAAPPAFTPRGLWFTRVWWPILIAGGGNFLAACTLLLTQ